MKKYFILTLLFSATFFCAQAQITLEKQTHGLRAGDVYTTLQTEYLSPGASGANILWDFSSVSCSSNKASNLVPVNSTTRGNEFSDATVAVEDDGNFFYFQIDDFANRFWGLVTANAVIKYDNPIIKIEYPFTFGDFTNTKYTGQGLYNETLYSSISGNYTAKADAYGTLLLPEGIALQNVLRVQTCDTVVETSCSTTTIINKKYLWYAAEARYPLFVTRISTTINANGEISETKKSYYNATAVENIISETIASVDKVLNTNNLFNVYPNPYTENIKIDYTLSEISDIKIQEISETGAILNEIYSNKSAEGKNLFNYSPKKTASGISFLKFTVNNKVIMKKIVKID